MNTRVKLVVGIVLMIGLVAVFLVGTAGPMPEELRDENPLVLCGGIFLISAVLSMPIWILLFARLLRSI